MVLEELELCPSWVHPDAHRAMVTIQPRFNMRHRLGRAAFEGDLYHDASREAAWYATTPMGIMAVRYAEVNSLLKDHRLGELGGQAPARPGHHGGSLVGLVEPDALQQGRR